MTLFECNEEGKVMSQFPSATFHLLRNGIFLRPEGNPVAPDAGQSAACRWWPINRMELHVLISNFPSAEFRFVRSVQQP